MSDALGFDLPEVPPAKRDLPVAGWRQPVTIESYLPDPPDRYPAYLDSRVYQGSSGRVYPMPFHDRISPERRPHSWDAFHLENQWVRLMILPELGGRIHLALDKRNGYDIFYRNPVIKPALVGLTGPWIAGGVEFNWPQHHRPATFLPTDATLETASDDSVTLWCSDHDPHLRMKGMHGIRLHPDRTTIELTVRLYNRTDEPQTFLWWANVAAEAHQDYQSFFPPDVRAVADHAKRAVSSYPVASGRYYGVDYPSRRGLARHRGSELEVPGDRLDWYRNIPVPTSYMIIETEGAFFGGYDHRAGAGFVHWADRHYAVGKKQWTWGNAPFGHAWDRNLADHGAHYVELMAGVYSDNQPDFSHLAPAETKTFTQIWYPIIGTGPVQQATPDAAASVAVSGRSATVIVNATRDIAAAELRLRCGPTELWSARTRLGPDHPARHRVDLPVNRDALELIITEEGREVLHWQESEPGGDSRLPAPANEPAAPEELDTVEELYLTGVHLAQYRHATRSPEPYWQQALRRDPGHVGSHVALAGRRHRQGRQLEAEDHLRAAIARQTTLNPNPADGEPHYRLGLALLAQRRDGEAYAAFAKATWNHAWVAAGNLQLARIDAAAGRNQLALQRAEAALTAAPQQLQAIAVKAVLLRRLGSTEQATEVIDSGLRIDPLDGWLLDLRDRRLPLDAQVAVDIALEYQRLGAYDDALRLLQTAVDLDGRRASGQPACTPLAHYHRAAVLDLLDRPAAATRARTEARDADPGYCFPGRLQDAEALRLALDADPDDHQASALLGHWLYAVGRSDQAIAAWEQSIKKLPEQPVVLRNLGVASYNQHHDHARSVDWYERALETAPSDARLWYERDQLAKRSGEAVQTRVQRLAAHPAAVRTRDDLAVEYANLLVDLDDPAAADQVLTDRTFQPWEGGEGAVLRCWERVKLRQSRHALAAGAAAEALRHAEAALDPPDHLGEARHPLANPAELIFTLGEAAAGYGDAERAQKAWQDAADVVGDFASMAQQSYSENTFYSVLAARRIGDRRRERVLIDGLTAHRDDLAATPAKIDYFATSLPAMLLFIDDPQAEQDRTTELITGQLHWLAGDAGAAISVFRAVLADDPSDHRALDLLHLLPTLTDLAPEETRR